MSIAYIHGWDETAGKPVMCKVTEDGKLIINPTNIFENPPSEGQALKAPTSEWAFDHNADTDKHHTKYTDADVLAALNGVFTSLGRLDKNLMGMYNHITHLQSFRLRYASGSAYETRVLSVNNSPHLYVLGNQLVGPYVETRLYVYNGSEYKYLLNTDEAENIVQAALEDSPTEDEDEKAPTSEWAFDHNADRDAHFTEGFNKAAVSAFNAQSTTITTGTYDTYDLTDLNMIFLDDTGGNIDLRGFAGGSDGKIVFFIRQEVASDLNVRHENANPTAAYRIYTAPTGDQQMGVGEYGGFILIYKALRWRMINTLP